MLRYRRVELNCIKFDFSAIAARQLIQTSYLIAAESSQVVSMKHTFLARKVFLKIDWSSDTHWNKLCLLYHTMTFSRHMAFLPTLREELEFHSAVDALRHSDKSDTGLILSCSDNRLLSSNSESKLS